MQNGESKRLPERWDIWLAKVYFDDTDEFKYRPVLVIEPEVCYVLSLGITSHLPRDCWGGVCHPILGGIRIDETIHD